MADFVIKIPTGIPRLALYGACVRLDSAMISYADFKAHHVGRVVRMGLGARVLLAAACDLSSFGFSLRLVFVFSLSVGLARVVIAISRSWAPRAAPSDGATSRAHGLNPAHRPRISRPTMA